MREHMFPKKPVVAIVVGTFGSTALVNLQLESRKRFCPDSPCLIHDDGSVRSTELKQLCSEYGAQFTSSPQRFGHSRGDVAAMVAGFYFAALQNADLLVKFSRSWIPIKPWLEDLSELAQETRHTTYTNHGLGCSIGFRTECIAFHVKSWLDSGSVERLREYSNGASSVMVEHYVHQIARKLAGKHTLPDIRAHSPTNQYSDDLPNDGYAPWEMLSEFRQGKNPAVLWRAGNSGQDYWETSGEWGLSYTEADFNSREM